MLDYACPSEGEETSEANSSENNEIAENDITAAEAATDRVSSLRLRIGYATGHALNDLTSAMYFSYLLVFLECLGLSPLGAGVVLIVGQLVDGLATPIVGWLSDRFTCCKTACFGCLGGRRKSWYTAGMLIVSATFWTLFTPYPQGIDPTAYYSITNGLFQVGWATVQVSHMTIVPELTPLLSERTVLNSIRFAVTVGASIAVYLLVWAYTETTAASNSNDNDQGETSEQGEDQGNDDEEHFLVRGLQLISYVVLLTGAVLGFLFIWLVQEKPTAGQMKSKESDEESQDASHSSSQAEKHSAKSIPDWFKTQGFWSVGVNYTATRLCVNALQVYIPFFALHNMNDNPSAVATIPLTTFVGMCLSSFFAPKTSALLPGAAKLYLAGVVCLSVGAGIIFFLTDSASDSWVYVASILLGIGSAQLMVTSQTLVGELVGNDANGGVVFGINSLGDKVSTGIVIFSIQRSAEMMDEELAALYQLAASVVPFSCAAVGLLSLITVPRTIRDRQGCQDIAVTESSFNDDSDHFNDESFDSIVSTIVFD